MQRFLLMQSWLTKTLASNNFTIIPLAGDASFRCYFRVQHGEQTYVVMDAPPEKESCHAFIAIARAFAANGVQVPHIHAINLELGFLLLSDLGDELIAKHLSQQTVNEIYQSALTLLPRIHHCQRIPDWQLPYFNEQMIWYELKLFPEWFLQKHLNLSLSEASQKLLHNVFSQLSNVAQEQPQVCVHRDYHSRNLLLQKDGSMGVIDFQDAVIGPITYDAVSLLRDCYIAWPSDKVERWTLTFYQLLCDEKLVKPNQPEQFLLWFDWVGLQRHLKVIGIFSRLKYRDGKADFLNNLSRIFAYVIAVCEKYSKLNKFKNFLDVVVLPELFKHSEQQTKII